MPFTNTRGIKTAHVVSTELSIGPATSPVPRSTADRRSSPLCQRDVILSTRMMVLSAIMPTPRRRPANDMMFNVSPEA